MGCFPPAFRQIASSSCLLTGNLVAIPLEGTDRCSQNFLVVRAPCVLLGRAVVLHLGCSSELSPPGVVTGHGAGEPRQPGPEKGRLCQTLPWPLPGGLCAWFHLGSCGTSVSRSLGVATDLGKPWEKLFSTFLSVASLFIPLPCLLYSSPVSVLHGLLLLVGTDTLSFVLSLLPCPIFSF